jgi:hypothetical protein
MIIVAPRSPSPGRRGFDVRSNETPTALGLPSAPPSEMHDSASHNVFAALLWTLFPEQRTARIVLNVR